MALSCSISVCFVCPLQSYPATRRPGNTAGFHPGWLTPPLPRQLTGDDLPGRCADLRIGARPGTSGRTQSGCQGASRRDLCPYRRLESTGLIGCRAGEGGPAPAAGTRAPANAAYNDSAGAVPPLITCSVRGMDAARSLGAGEQTGASTKGAAVPVFQAVAPPPTPAKPSPGVCVRRGGRLLQDRAGSFRLFPQLRLAAATNAASSFPYRSGSS